MDREAVVAGQFYPQDKNRLLKELEKLTERGQSKAEAKGIIMPHAGYVYSGSVAGKTISRVNVRNTVVMLGPNHTGLGGAYSLASRGRWKTPLGDVPIDEQFSAALLERSALIRHDESAHIYEHSLEVELPFLQYFNGAVKIVPIIVRDFNIKHFQAAGKDIAETVKEYAGEVMLLASTDLTHYEPQEKAAAKDRGIIEAVTALDPDKLLRLVEETRVSMCGYAPVVILLYACLELGADRAELVDYRTSGDVSGDYDSVVGYAGFVIR